ncbi:DUF4239 domain-containing protein [Streptantibioticus parmotrematis]|uniref:bestrophin-like domain n=1 Tax=Streptantibioticus parmotrematis TaxID=2873249 RepID=UPI003403FFBF
MSHLLSTVAIVAGGALVAAVCVILKHRFFPLKADEEPSDDVAEYISMMIGVIYALVLGLALVSVWDTHSNAESDISTEAGALHQVYLLSDALPPAGQQEIRTTVDAYAHQVTAVEWPRMARHESLGPAGWQLLDKLRDTYETAPAANATSAQQNAGQEAISQLSTLDQARRGRASDAQSSLSDVLWAGMFVGGILTLAFMFVFGVQRSGSHLVMAMVLGGFMVFLILLIQQLNQPFSGVFAVGKTDFTSYFPV